VSRPGVSGTPSACLDEWFLIEAGVRVDRPGSGPAVPVRAPRRRPAGHYGLTVPYRLQSVTAGRPSVGEKFLYVFKGARSAPGLVGRRLGDRRARMTLNRTRRSSRRSQGGCSGGTLRAWAPLAALRPSGPRRRRRASPPRSPPHRLSAATISARRASCKSGPSSRRSSMKPGKITCKSASRHT